MDSLKISTRRAGLILAASVMAFATLLPSLVSAATITTRSIEMSSSVIGASSVYNVKFTTASTATATESYVIDFCTTPTINTTCSAPSDFAINPIGSTTSGQTVTEPSANRVQVVLDDPVGPSTEITTNISGIVNPSNDDPYYARIVTYATDTPAYTSASNVGSHVDEGSVALMATQGIGVSGSVLESLLFCVSGGDNITTGCGGTHTAPTVSLGTNGVMSTALTAGSVYSQLSTNAVGGAVVSLKSNTAGCGGLSRAGAASFAAGCAITPQYNSGTPAVINTGDAKFGVQLWDIEGVTPDSSYPSETTLNLAGNFFMEYPGNDTAGVTSAYGSPVFSSAGVVNDGTANLAFGANISNTTPAGTYSAALNLIATGKF